MNQSPIKTIFVCEFITAGGFNHAELPPSLAREGALMRDALLRDLAQLPYEITTTVDARLASSMLAYSVISIGSHDDVWQIWAQQMLCADAVWLIAPETDGLLAKLTALAVKQEKIIIGCGLQSIEVTASKRATFHALQQANILTIPTYTYETWPKGAGAWLAKSDDGVGCDETFFFQDANALASRIGALNKASGYIIQPFQVGEPASISCVMQRGVARVLSCNLQKISTENTQLKFNGCIVNGMRDYWAQFEEIANQIAQAMPDLAGYVGIDVIVDGGRIIVVEINPRLTTSYCALAEAIGTNPAQLILHSIMPANAAWPTLQRNVVEVNV